MKFENKGKWFNESEDTDKDMLNDEQQELAMEDDAGDLLAEDDLNLADEDIDDDSEGIFNDEEQVDEACKQKDESWFDLYPVVSDIGEDWEFYKKKPKYTRNELKQAAITKLKAKGKSFNSQDLEEALNRWYQSESAQKNEGVHFGQPNVDKCYNELMDISFQEMKKRNGKELSDKEFEAFRPTLLKKYPKEVVDYCYMKANESAQKNEANMLRDTEIAFENIGGGISCFFESDKYGQKQLDVSVGLFSSSSRGNYTKSYGTMPNVEAKKQQEIDKPKILKELKVLADNLDKNVKTLLAKYGYTLSK